ncbi:LytR C-terminal domain-containing protein [Streptomyces uncialis]|uniref:LytR C-terminal domain-containing protein n=1 Tax=Streptomyces uncialis TaxID=1048205 RepID=UPI0033E1D25F
MNGRDDRYDGYPGGTDPEGADGSDGFASYELAGYDEYGRPVYQQAAAPEQSRQQQGWTDPYGGQGQAPGPSYDAQQGYGTPDAQGYDTPQDHGGQQQSYGTFPADPQQAYGTATGYDPAQGQGGGYGTGQGYDNTSQGYDSGSQGYGNTGQGYGDPSQGYENAAQGRGDVHGGQDQGYGSYAAPAPSYGDYGAQPGARGQGQADPYDPYGRAGAAGQRQHADPPAPGTAEQTAYIPPQTAAPTAAHPAGPTAYPGHGTDPGRTAGGPGTPYAAEAAEGAAPDTQAGPADPDTSDQADGQRDYRTEQFAFVEEPEGEPEDVIDWLSFTENRTERREEAKRRARGRVVALVVVLALIVVGGVGYLFLAGKLPGLSDDDGSSGPAAGPQKRDVVLVHLHNTKKGGTSTALLVDNTTTKQGNTVLLPNALSVSADDGSTTTLAKSVEDDGSSGTRESVDTLLGTRIEGTWRLDTPFLSNLVDLVGNIDIDTDANVPSEKAKKGDVPLVKQGAQQTLSGRMAVAYATYRAPGEGEEFQLARFGQVMQGILRKISSDAGSATVTVESLAQILDPSLSEKDLGAFLARLSDRAKGGDYKTALLPVESDGALTAQATETVVKPLLGGTVKSPEQGDAVRVSVRNAGGSGDAAEAARVVLVNGGYTFVEGGKGATAATTRVLYAGDARKADAVEVAKTLDLPTSVVREGEVDGNAEVAVVLGQDYTPKKADDGP